MDSKTAEQKLEEAFKTYRETPSQENREAFLNVADAYKEHWIEAQATGGLPKQKNPEAPTRYKRLYSVQGEQWDGTQITLALQYRSLPDNAAFYAVSWRTRLGPEQNQHRINRRFYWSNDSVWTIDASLALSMLEELEKMGGLDEKYFDRRAQPDSDFFSSETLEEVTMPHEDWGKNPFLVVLKDPDEDWRKILIMNRAGQATFRSVAKSDAYKGPRKELRPDLKWYLDNSMQDVSVQLARAFLDELRRNRGKYKFSDRFVRTARSTGKVRKQSHIGRWDWIDNGGKGRTYSEINRPDSDYRKLIDRSTYGGNTTSIDADLNYDIKEGWIKKV